MALDRIRVRDIKTLENKKGNLADSMKNLKSLMDSLPIYDDILPKKDIDRKWIRENERVKIDFLANHKFPLQKTKKAITDDLRRLDEKNSCLS